MSSDSQTFDPYRSPTLPEGADTGRLTSGRPGMLTVLCVLCMVLGALGMINGCFGAVGLLVGKQIQRVVTSAQPPTGMPKDIHDAQMEMQRAMYAIQDKYIWALSIGLIWRFAAGALLFVGGILTLMGREQGRRILIAGCLIAAPFVLLDAILQSLIAVENMTVMNSFIETMTASTSGQQVPAGFEGTMRAMSGAIKIGAVAVTTLLAVAKLALFVFGIIYLQKDHIRGLFVPAVPA